MMIDDWWWLMMIGDDWWLIDWFIDWLIAWLLACLIDWLAGWLVACLIDWLAGWLIGWLVDWLMMMTTMIMIMMLKLKLKLKLKLVIFLFQVVFSVARSDCKIDLTFVAGKLYSQRNAELCPDINYHSSSWAFIDVSVKRQICHVFIPKQSMTPQPQWFYHMFFMANLESFAKTSWIRYWNPPLTAKSSCSFTSHFFRRIERHPARYPIVDFYLEDLIIQWLQLG